MKPVAGTKEARDNYDRIFVKEGPPVGLSQAQFECIAEMLRESLKHVAERTGDLGEDVFVHGSRDGYPRRRAFR
jgi:hypothetical protein